MGKGRLTLEGMAQEKGIQESEEDKISTVMFGRWRKRIQELKDKEDQRRLTLSPGSDEYEASIYNSNYYEKELRIK